MSPINLVDFGHEVESDGEKMSDDEICDENFYETVVMLFA